MRYFTLLTCALLCQTGFYGYTQTTLAPGDIAIIMGKADNPDKFAFFTKVSLDAGTVIYFTDCGADAAGFNSPVCLEGAVKYTAPAGGIAAGSIIIYEGVGGGTNFVNYTDSRITFGFSLDVNGDQIIAFQDSNPGAGLDPGQEPTFLFALNLASTEFTGNKGSALQTGLPNGLSTTGTITALGVGMGMLPSDEWDNAVYNGSYNYSDFDAAYMAFTDTSNWLRTDIDIVGGPLEMAINNIPAVIILPIELIDFYAKPYDNYIALNWQTALELNNHYMAVERSSDGRTFAEIGRVGGAGTVYEMQTYTFADERPMHGINYYRLRQVDYDGTSTYHKVIAVPFGKQRESANIYPSLARDRIALTLNDPLTTDTQLEIQNIKGQIVARQVLKAGEQQWDFAIQNLEAGQYIVRFRLSDEIVVKRFFKF